jgi:hypothetical protein
MKTSASHAQLLIFLSEMGAVSVTAVGKDMTKSAANA